MAKKATDARMVPATQAAATLQYYADVAAAWDRFQKALKEIPK